MVTQELKLNRQTERADKKKLISLCAVALLCILTKFARNQLVFDFLSSSRIFTSSLEKGEYVMSRGSQPLPLSIFPSKMKVDALTHEYIGSIVNNPSGYYSPENRIIPLIEASAKEHSGI